MRDEADQMAHIRGFNVAMLDETDQQFIEALRRFKPLVVEEGRYRNFQSLADVERVRTRLDQLVRMVDAFVARFPAMRESLRKTFNTAVVQFAISGKLEPAPLQAAQLERFVAKGFELPDVDLPEAIAPFAERWWADFREEFEPLAGKSIDPRFIATVHVTTT
jgi:hypothetical protein